MFAVLLFASCAAPRDRGRGSDEQATVTTPTHDTAASDSGEPDPTTVPTLPVDCEGLPDTASYFTIDIQTQEDFDFDGYGYLIH